MTVGDYRTINVSKEVHKKLKTIALERDNSIKNVIEKLVNDYLKNKKRLN